MLIYPQIGIGKHENDFHHLPFKAFFKNNAALKQGQGVALVPDYTTANSGETSSDRWGKRDKIVEPLDKTNVQWFAGVVSENYDAKTNGRWIDIYPPASTALIQVSETVSIGDRVACMVEHDVTDDNGKFSKTLGLEGAGQAIVMEDGSADDLVMAKLLDGPGIGVVEKEKFAADGTVNGFSLVGLSYIKAQTISGNATYTLADGSYYGQRKAFELGGALSTNDLVITVTNGIQADDSTALTTVTMDASGDTTVLEWLGDKWKVVHNTGSALASS
jgi:hypothetical protein